MLKRKEFILGAAAGLIIAAGATAGGVISWPAANAEGRPGQLIPSAGASGLAFAPPQGAPLSFADIVQQVAPAVVQIEVESRVERPTGGIQIPGFPGFVIPNPQGAEPDPDAEPETARGAGSGFFITKDGFIVTNNHVVADATSISVVLSDGRKLEAKLIGRDQNSDLAVIKVEGDDFSFVSFEEQADPRVGDWVVAVGNPFGLGGTATAGIVSAKGRNDLDSSTPYTDYLQIDAAINRGNSGGPTFDIYGRVIGVNSAIISPTGGSVGIGFAIPASVAKPVVDQLMRGERVQRGYVGIGIRSLSPEMWEALGQPEDFKGALIETVNEGGPAAAGGVRPNDIAVAVNGVAVSNGTELTRQVGRAKPGDTLRLEVIRDGRRQTLTIRAGTRPPEEELAAQLDGSSSPSAEAQSTAGTTVEGVTVGAITPALRQRYNIADSVTGVVVTRVAPNSKAGQLGLPLGAVITRANFRNIGSAADLSAEIAEARRAGRERVLLFVWRPQGTVMVPLELSKAE